MGDMDEIAVYQAGGATDAIRSFEIYGIGGRSQEDPNTQVL